MVSGSSSSIYFPLLPSIFKKTNLKKREAKQKRQALAKSTCREVKLINERKIKKMSVERRDAYCELEAGAIDLKKIRA